MGKHLRHYKVITCLVLWTLLIQFSLSFHFYKCPWLPFPTVWTLDSITSCHLDAPQIYQPRFPSRVVSVETLRVFSSAVPFHNSAHDRWPEQSQLRVVPLLQVYTSSAVVVITVSSHWLVLEGTIFTLLRSHIFKSGTGIKSTVSFLVFGSRSSYSNSRPC